MESILGALRLEFQASRLSLGRYPLHVCSRDQERLATKRLIINAIPKELMDNLR